jgi:uncharacterized integral membrane protein
MTDTPGSGSRRPEPESSGWAESDAPPTEAGSTSAGTAGEVATQPQGGRPGGDDTARTSSRPPEQENLLGRTRASQTWTAIIVFAVVLVLLLIFILENTQKVTISYFGATGHLPLAVAMLLASVAGIVLTAIAGTFRILQLRRRVRRGQRARKA